MTAMQIKAAFLLNEGDHYGRIQTIGFDHSTTEQAALLMLQQLAAGAG